MMSTYAHEYSLRLIFRMCSGCPRATRLCCFLGSALDIEDDPSDADLQFCAWGSGVLGVI